MAVACAALLIAVGRRRTEARDGIDNAPARRFEFAWRVSSTIFDASALLPLAWVHRVASPRASAVALVAAGASYLVSYQLARGQGLGYLGRESFVFRVVTASVLLFALLAGSLDDALLEAPLWVFAALVAAGAVRQTWAVRTEDRTAVASQRTP